MSYQYPPVAPNNGATFVEARHDTYPEIDPKTQSDLRGKTVFISGASKGVGRATAISYAKAGASQIAIAARSSFGTLEAEIQDAAKAAKHKTPQVLSLGLDVQDAASVKAAAEATENAFGRLDILVNNAGYLDDIVPIVDSDADEHWRAWEINYRGLYWTTKAFLPLIIKTGDGLKTIVNLSSIGAMGLRPGMSGYQTTKYAVLKFTEFICVEHAKDGVVAYSVHPGSIMTNMGHRMPKAMHNFFVDTPELAADSIVFLTQERREWLAGRYVSLTWDLPKFLARKDEIVEGDKLKMRMNF